MNKRFLIALDGLDGSGKETQTKLLMKYLEEEKIPYKYVSFPTYEDEWSVHLKMYLDGRFGNDPNAVNSYAASSFFASDRYCSYMLDWKRNYENGDVILCNRYTTANAVHQLSKLPEEQWDSFLNWLYDYEFDKLGLPKPDLCIYLCIPPEIVFKNIATRSVKDNRKGDIHERSHDHLEQSYKAAKYSSEKLNWKTINCESHGGMRTIDDIHRDVVAVVKEYLK